MRSDGRKYLLDANVLITAHRQYYAFDLCPGFWNSVLTGCGAGRIFSTRRIEAELLAGGDALSEWVKRELPAAFFLDDSSGPVTKAYAPMMAWVASHGFLPAAVAEFAAEADGWLIAAAKATGHCVVTHETRKLGARARVPIPNVCEEFGVPYCNSFEMLRDLGCSFR